MKKVLVAFSFIVVATASQAGYLYWQVTPTSDSTVSSATAWDSGYNNSAKTVSTVDMSDLSNGNGAMYSYFIELASSKTTPSASVSATTSQTYADLQTAGSIQATAELSAVPQATVWHTSGASSASPEPTSAMLMLLGVAGLALRRKQRNMA